MDKLHQLVSSHTKLINSEAAKHAKFLPIHVVEAEAYRIANDAAHSFDPKSGNQFATHLTNQLKQLSRFSTQYGGSVRLPEQAQFTLNKVNKIKEELHSEHGRDPTISELADKSNIPIAKLQKLLDSRKGGYSAESTVLTPTFTDDGGAVDDWIHFVYHDLTPIDKTIFEHYTGFAGKPVLNEQDIAKKLKLSDKIVGQRIKFITNEIGKIS